MTETSAFVDCPNCQTKMRSLALVCWRCGWKPAFSNCPACQNNISRLSLSCFECGWKLYQNEIRQVYSDNIPDTDDLEEPHNTYDERKHQNFQNAFIVAGGLSLLFNYIIGDALVSGFLGFTISFFFIYTQIP